METGRIFFLIVCPRCICILMEQFKEAGWSTHNQIESDLTKKVNVIFF